MKNMQSLGGHARAKSLTKKRRVEIAKKAIQTRWSQTGDNSKRILASKYKNATIKK